MGRNLYDTTIQASKGIGRRTKGKGEVLDKLPDGCVTRNYINHIDDRGRVFEIWDERSTWHSTPVNRVYCCAVRPKVIKGWGLHEKNEDRYCIIQGELIVVLYDVRPHSKTEGKVFKITLSSSGPSQLSIPPGIWHAIQNPGETEAFLINLATELYDYEAPDKKLLPIDTPLIPWKF